MQKRKIVQNPETRVKRNKKPNERMTIEFHGYPYGSLSTCVSTKVTHRSMFLALFKGAKDLTNREDENRNENIDKLCFQLKCMQKGKLAYRIHYELIFDEFNNIFDRIFQSECIPHYPHFFIANDDWFSELKWSYRNGELLKRHVVENVVGIESRLHLHPVLELKIQCLPDVSYINLMCNLPDSKTMTPKRKQILQLLKKWIPQDDVVGIINDFLNNGWSEFCSGFARCPIPVNPLYYHMTIGQDLFHADQWESDRGCVHDILDQMRFLQSKDFYAETFSCSLHMHLVLPKPEYVLLKECPSDWTFGWFVIWNEIVRPLFHHLFKMEIIDRYNKGRRAVLLLPYYSQIIEMYSITNFMDYYMNRDARPKKPEYEAVVTYVMAHTFEELLRFDWKIHGPKLIPLIVPLLDTVQDPLSIALRNLKPSEWSSSVALLPDSAPFNIDWMSIKPKSIQTYTL